MAETHEQDLIKSILVEGFDESKIVRKPTYDDDIMKVIGAWQNRDTQVVQAEVRSFITHNVGADNSKKIQCAVVRIGKVEGILPFDLSGEESEQRFKNLIGRTVAFIVEKYTYDEGQGYCTFVANRSKAKEIMTNLLFRKVNVGDVVYAVVSHMTTTTLFADVGGIQVRMSSRDLSYEWIDSIQDQYEIGEHIKVKVVEINKEEKTIKVSAKALEENPWNDINKHYRRGQEVTGVISGVRNYGYFVNLDKGVDSLCPHLRHEVLSVGDKVVVRVTNVNQAKQRISGNIKEVLQRKHV